MRITTIFRTTAKHKKERKQESGGGCRRYPLFLSNEYTAQSFAEVLQKCIQEGKADK